MSSTPGNNITPPSVHCSKRPISSHARVPTLPATEQGATNTSARHHTRAPCLFVGVTACLSRGPDGRRPEAPLPELDSFEACEVCRYPLLSSIQVLTGARSRQEEWANFKMAAAMATRGGGRGLRALCMNSSGKDVNMLPSDHHHHPQSPAGHLPHSSDDSSATTRLDASSAKGGCSSPTSELEHATLSPSAAHTPADIPLGPIPPSINHHSPTPSPVTPITPAPTADPAAAAAAGQREVKPALGTALEPLSAPDASEGPAAAAEYAAYHKRWQEGSTLAQRWARLAASGKVSTIQDDWDDMQLDALLLTHCSNTPAAAATRAIARAAAAGSSSGLRASKSGSNRRTRADLEIDASAGEAAAAADDAYYNFEGAAISPSGTRRVRSRQAPKSFRDFEVDLPAGAKSGSGSPEPPAAAAAVFSPAGGQHEMDVYVGAGILLDLHSSTPPAKQQQQQPQAQPPKPQQKPKQQQQQQRPQGRRTHVLKMQPQQQQPQHQQPQQLLPVLQTRPKVTLVLDLSESPKHSTQTFSDASLPAASSPSRLSGQQQHQQQQRQFQLHLGFPHGATPSPTAQHSQLPPRMPHTTPAQHLVFSPHTFQQQQHQAHAQLQQQQQQQQQQADLKAEQVQAALAVASKLGAALGSDSAAFARIMSFVNHNSNKPAALFQFMSATLADIEGSKSGGSAAAAAAAVLSPKKQPPRGLML